MASLLAKKIPCQDHIPKTDAWKEDTGMETCLQKYWELGEGRWHVHEEQSRRWTATQGEVVIFSGIENWDFTLDQSQGKGGSSTCLFLHGRSFPLRFSTAYQILFEIAHWTWDSRCLITHLIRLSRSLVMQPPASSSHHFWSEVKTHLHMPENTPIMGRLGKELWKQSSATPYGLCTPKKLLKSCGNVFQRRSLQKQCICAVKSLCWHGLLFPPQCCWCYQFCILSCIVSTEVSLLPWGSPQGLQVLENRNKCHPETHPASSWLFRLPPELHQ